MRIDIPASHEGNLGSRITYRRYERLADDRILQLGLHDLMRKGNSFEPGTDMLSKARKAFGTDSPEGMVTFVAEDSDGKAVGYMTVDEWQTGEKVTIQSARPRGGRLLRALNVRVPGFDKYFADYSQAHPSRIIEINGIVTDPDLREKGILKGLAHQAFTELNPIIVLGQSMNPAAVEAGAKIAGGFGYRTWFGLNEVTPGVTETEPIDSVVQEIIKGYTSVSGRGRDGFLEEDKAYATSDAPDPDTFRPAIQEAIRGLASAQRAADSEGRNVGLFLPLVSVRADFLRGRHERSKPTPSSS